MDPDAALRMIDDADRVDAETREVMRGLHQWLARGGFQPDWDAYPTGTRRYRKAYGKRHGARIRGSAPTAKRGKLATQINQALDLYMERGEWDGLSLGGAREVLTRAGYTWTDVREIAVARIKRHRSDPTFRSPPLMHGVPRGRSTRSHAVVRASAGNGGIQIGDIVQRADLVGKNRYVVINIAGPWIYTRRISGSGAPGIITFPGAQMLRKVD